jgi:hypothetical protein
LIALKSEAEVDESTWLDYAQALLLAGQTEEARTIYQRLAASGSPDSAIKAKRQLAQLPLLPSANANANTQATPRDPRLDQTENRNTEAPPPQPTPSTPATPAPSAQPSPTPSAPANSNNNQVTQADEYYDRGMEIISKSDLKSLPRAQLLQALEYFQRAQNGTRRAEATRHIQQLGREYDRRKKQSLP